MTTLDTSHRVGLAQLARAAMGVLFQTLGEAIKQENEYWVPLDEELAVIREIDYSPLVIEPVDPKNFYLGHVPSLIEAPIEKYPNVAVDADRAGSSGSDDLDQAQTFGLNLYIEFMVKSKKDEEEVSDRASRMLDAINGCMLSNRTLGGTVHEVGETPIGQLSDVFIRSSEPSYGKPWFWRGGRIEYVVQKVAQIPSSSSLTAADYASIDQA